MVSPIQFLILLVLLTCLAAATERLLRLRRARVLRHYARQWHMHYVHEDRFRIGERVRGRMPLAGAADVRVFDLMYRTEEKGRRYVFTCEFGRGVVFSQRRRRCVMACSEVVGLADGEEELHVARLDLPVVEQYRSVMNYEI